MKKIFILFLVVVTIMAITVPAFAVETADAAPAASCTHSGTPTSEMQLTYVYKNNSVHNKYRTYVYYCRSCGVCLGSSNATLVGSYDHTFEPDRYIESYHLGDYTGHYYIYGRTCRFCEYTYTWRVNAACTKSHCVDPE